MPARDILRRQTLQAAEILTSEATAGLFPFREATLSLMGVAAFLRMLAGIIPRRLRLLVDLEARFEPPREKPGV